MARAEGAEIVATQDLFYWCMVLYELADDLGGFAGPSALLLLEAKIQPHQFGI